MSTDYYRPSIQQIIDAVAETFGVSEKDILSFEQCRSSRRAKAAVALLAQEQGYALQRIGMVLGRDHTTIGSNILSARTMLKEEEFASMVSAVRTVLMDERKRKPMTEDEMHRQKLEQHKAEILKLRNLYGKDVGWSDRSLSKRFGIPVHILAPVIGIQKAER